MIPDKETLDKLAKKRQYKLRGVFLSLERVNGSIATVLITKGQGIKKETYCFTAFGAEALALEQLKKGYRIKIWFVLKSKEYNKKWYNSFVVKSFEHWIVNEDKLKKQARIDELLNKQKQIEWGEGEFEK